MPRSSGSSTPCPAEMPNEKISTTKPQMNADERGSKTRLDSDSDLRLSAFICGYIQSRLRGGVRALALAAQPQRQTGQDHETAEPDELHQRVDVYLHPPAAVTGRF